MPSSPDHATPAAPPAPTPSSRVVVVGGANIDVEGRSSTRPVPGDSTPGTVGRTAGGVGRNIAHNLANLGAGPALITVLGSDADGRRLFDVTAAAGVEMGETVWSDRSTATYLSIVDAAGELICAVNDMEVLASLDPTVIEARTSVLSRAEVVVADCNLDGATLRAVAERATNLFVDPVSTMKAERIRPLLARVHTLKPNRMEAAALSGMEITDNRSLHQAGRALLDQGVQRVVISLGAEGAMLIDHSGPTTIEAPDHAVASVTGAGDAMTAGLVHAHLRGMGREESVRFGLAAAAITAAHPHTVNDDLTERAVYRLMEETTR